jgi:hypothetical protein
MLHAVKTPQWKKLRVHDSSKAIARRKFGRSFHAAVHSRRMFNEAQ